MLFSVSYHSKHKDKADEIRCPYNQLGSIIKFVKDNPDKRYNIIFPEDGDMEKLIQQINLLKDITPNYTIQCKRLPILHSLRHSSYNAYLAFPISDWESFADLLQIEVSDIYIDGPLGFQDEALRKGKGETLIRVSPTVSPNTVLAAKRNPNSFYIRPEDLSSYSAIDVIDFQEPDQDKEDALFQIYKRGTFNYDLNQLVTGLPAGNNLMLKSDFGRVRRNCGQKCNIPGYSCHVCNQYFTVMNLLKQLK